MSLIALLREQMASLPGAVLRTENRNTFLTTAGMVERHLYFIVSGAVRVYYHSGKTEHTIRLGYKNSFITSLDSFLTDTPSLLYIQVIKKTRLWSIPRSAFRDFIQANATRMALYQQLLEEMLQQQLQREMDILTGSPKERYQRVLQRSPQLFQEVPLKYIASYLRMTPETLSRLRKS